MKLTTYYCVTGHGTIYEVQAEDKYDAALAADKACPQGECCCGVYEHPADAQTQSEDILKGIQAAEDYENERRKHDVR